jgi:hypothetical protein
VRSLVVVEDVVAIQVVHLRRPSIAGRRGARS